MARRRKMIRTFLDWPVDEEVLQRILAKAQRAPSAGYTQGVEFLVLSGGAETVRFWEAVSTEPDWPGQGLRDAPVLIVPVGGKRAYLQRYAEDDKGWSDQAESRWPVPYWLVDAAFASMLILLSAVDEGLGALFFGLERAGYERLYEAFGIPSEWESLGVIALGHPAPADSVRSSAHTRSRKRLADLVHRGRW